MPLKGAYENPGLPWRSILRVIRLVPGLFLLIVSVGAAPVEMMLGRPTSDSIALSMLSTETVDASVAYRPSGGNPRYRSATVRVEAGRPVTIDLTGLLPNTHYEYWVEYSPPGGGVVSATNLFTFHTRRPVGESFRFIVHTDLHFGDSSTCDPAVYSATASNILADQPDFLIDMGDCFMTEKFLPDPITWDSLDDWTRDLRNQYLGQVGHSVPVLMATGNHESELGWLIPPSSLSDNRAVWSTRIREQYFPGPIPGPAGEEGFFGSAVIDPALQGPRNSFYAFNWGNALMIVLDPFWYTTSKPASGTPDPWKWTLGEEQYFWLQDVLAHNTMPFTFVFLHHLVGGTDDGRGRGGLEAADFFEWGGYNADGTWGFSTRRPGWEMPIQQLLLEHGVQVVFHGHDHLFIKQDLDADQDGKTDLVYLECPQPASRIPNGDKNAAEYGYLSSSPDALGRSGTQGGGGHVRVVIENDMATIEYVRAYSLADRNAEKVNGAVSYSFTVTGREAPVAEAPFPGSVILGRPTQTSITANLLSPTTSGDVFLKWSAESGGGSSAVVSLPAGQPVEVEMTGLSPDTRYNYQVWFRPAGTPGYHPSPEKSFHTARPAGSTFTFTIQGDSHPERRSQFDGKLYERTLLTASADQPDFHILMGDDFSVDTLDAATISEEQVIGRYTLQRPYLGLIGDTAPLYLVNGNHEQAARYLLDGTPDNVAVWAQNARNAHYPQPAPDGFYSGNDELVPYIGYLRNHYAWEWGDALFVVIDPYWASPTCIDNPFGGGDKRSDWWDITHGDAQYFWLKETLEQSNARFKFVFAHHVLGSGRGGVKQAALYEWGGTGKDGTWGFEENRPDWPMPIHQLMAANDVTIFFQGHDHVWAREELNGIIYQTLSEPADPNYALYFEDEFTGITYPNSGYTRVTVSPTGVEVAYVRSWLPQDEGLDRVHGTVAYRYDIGMTATPWGDITGGWVWSPFGWVHDAAFPYIYLASAQCYGYVPAESTHANLYCYLFQGNGHWIYTNDQLGGWCYSLGGDAPGWFHW